MSFLQFLIACLISIMWIITIQKISIYVKYNHLIKSNRYKNSNYRIYKYGKDYSLRFKTGEYYIYKDLTDPINEEDNKNHMVSHCRGSKEDVINAFNLLVPVIY